MNWTEFEKEIRWLRYFLPFSIALMEWKMNHILKDLVLQLPNDL